MYTRKLILEIVLLFLTITHNCPFNYNRNTHTIMSSVEERNLILNLHQRYVERGPRTGQGGRRGLTIINPPENPSQLFKDHEEFIHNLFDQYGHDAHEFLREEEEEATGFLLWHKDKLINRDNEHGGPRYFQLPDIADIKDTFEQYVQSVDAALISQYDTHNINIP